MIEIKCAKCGSGLEVADLTYQGGIQVEPCPVCISKLQDRAAKFRAALDEFEDKHGKKA